MDWADTVLRAAVLAPSGDNLQPWQFGLDREADALRLATNPHRDPSPMNAGGTMGRISLGALLINVLRTYHHNRRRLPEVRFSSRGDVELYRTGLSSAAGGIPLVLRRRYTDRSFYGGDGFTGQLTKLVAEAEQEFAAWARHCGVPAPVYSTLTAHLLVDKGRLREAAEAMVRSDWLLFRHDAARAAFVEALRKGETASGSDGLPVDSLRLGRWESRLLRSCLKLPPRALRWLGFHRNVARRTRTLLATTPALLVVTASGWTAQEDLLIGMLVQTLWLRLTEARFVAQPMMALPVLRNMARHGAGTFAELDELEEQMAAAGDFDRHARVAFIMRVGRATQPGASPGRLPWQSLAYEWRVEARDDARSRQCEARIDT